MTYDENSESDYFFFLHQNQNIFFSKFTKINILKDFASNKQKKNHSTHRTTTRLNGDFILDSIISFKLGHISIQKAFLFSPVFCVYDNTINKKQKFETFIPLSPRPFLLMELNTRIRFSVDSNL
jgi:hypothetical protein